MARRRFNTVQDFLDEWNKRIPRIDNDVFDLLGKRKIFRRLGEIWKANPRLHRPSTIYAFINETYATHLLVTVRRVVDQTKGTVSLRRLLDDVHRNRGLLTREWFVARESLDLMRDQASQTFSQYAGEAPCVSGAIVLADIAKLDAAVDKVVTVANESIAHHAEEPSNMSLLNSDVDSSIDAVFEMYRRYYLLLRYAEIAEHGLTILEDWSVLRIPWIDS